MSQLVKTFSAALLLSASAPALAQPNQAAQASPSDEKLICKKWAPIGSLVKTNKVCLTRKQWARSAENHKNYAAELQERLRTRPCGDPSNCN
jgi:hypothetical protein